MYDNKGLHKLISLTCGYNWCPDQDGNLVLDTVDAINGLHKNGDNAKWCSHSNCPKGCIGESSVISRRGATPSMKGEWGGSGRGRGKGSRD